MNEKDYGSFSLKNININSNNNENENEIEQNSKSIIKNEINKYSTFNNNQNNNVFNNINKINDIQYESSKKSANFENKDEKAFSYVCYASDGKLGNDSPVNDKGKIEGQD
jgi:hypothetical protein